MLSHGAILHLKKLGFHFLVVVGAQEKGGIAHCCCNRRGVGTDHREWYAREIGELGVDVLDAVKATLDPPGIMNPGVLLPLR